MRGLLFIIVLSNLMCAQTWAEETTPIFPRLFVEESYVEYCVIETDLRWNQSDKRQIEFDFRRILDFLSDPPKSGGLTGFTDPDFVGLDHFSLFYASNCSEAESESEALQREIEEEIGSGKLNFKMIPYPESDMVVEKALLPTYYNFVEKNRENLANCFIAVRSLDQSVDSGKIFDALDGLFFKYRFPILSVEFEDEQTAIFVLFDQCEDKEAVIRRAMAWSDMAEEFAQPGRYILEDADADRYFALRR